nr:bifunctional adenosylcobinamide kinase/adenosylcobinamide-phosphate guanylyltransferase [Desulfobulbaceae bacterium]
MGKSNFIVGGARSGKSDFALELAEKIGSSDKYFLATCPAYTHSDAEMAARIYKHKEGRQGRGWTTIEEELDLCQALQELPENAIVLIDCMTLWVSNLLHAQGAGGVDEKMVEQHIERLFELCSKRSGAVVMVSGEVGCSVVPENALARSFRDLVGRCNQTVGRLADSVFMVSCGIAIQIKG